MDWTDRGLVIGVRKYGETSVILELMSEQHGRHLGVVRGGRSRSMQPTLQLGNSVTVSWRARIEDHIGAYAVEGSVLRAGRLMMSVMALQGLHWLGAALRFLPEREPHGALYAMADSIAEHLDNPAIAPELLVRFELALLSELGFRLDLAQCAATGAIEDLIYVSPKSGRAVCRAAGDPWKQKLLALPPFLLESAIGGRIFSEIEVGLALTGHFLMRDLFGPRGITPPDCRAHFLREARKAQTVGHTPIE